jgi:[ribosomal protein S5]-alanine N-acetyltransferase
MRAFFHQSRRIGFSTWSMDDLPLAQGLWGDAEVTRYNGGGWSAQQIENRLILEITTLDKEGVQYWPMFLLETEEHIGCCGIHPRDKVNGVWEFGCHLRRAFWSKSLGREAAKAVISYAFDTLGVSSLFAGHHPSNLASQRFLHYLGFRYTHDEFYQLTQIVEPCYVLSAPGHRIQ